jgi:hypothetical protein
MALDRTWYNALVDDNGSNQVGTIWNKTQVDYLLDSVDAEFARTLGLWVARPFNAANYYAEPPLTWTPTAGQIYFDRYTYVGNTLVWHIRMADITLGGTAGGHLHVTLPGTRLPTVTTQLIGVDAYSNGVYAAHKFYVAVGSTDCWIRRIDYSPISPGVFFAELFVHVEVNP